MAKNSPRPKSPHDGPTILAAAQHIEVSSSSLPSPQELHEYERIHPGAAKIIFEMAEREQAERHRAQNFALETLRLDNLAERAAEKRGQWMAVLFLWGNLLAAVLLAFYGFTIPASILAGASAANVLNTIITRLKK